MFRKFIRRLYKQKALASGAPEDPEELAALLADVRDSVGLTLDPKDFKKDNCRRQLAKFSLNNIWVKLYTFHIKTLYISHFLS